MWPEVKPPYRQAHSQQAENDDRPTALLHIGTSTSDYQHIHRGTTRNFDSPIKNAAVLLEQAHNFDRKQVRNRMWTGAREAEGRYGIPAPGARVERKRRIPGMRIAALRSSDVPILRAPPPGRPRSRALLRRTDPRNPGGRRGVLCRTGDRNEHQSTDDHPETDHRESFRRI